MNKQEWDLYTAEATQEPTISGADFPRMKWTEPDRVLCKGWNANGGPNVCIWLDWRGMIGRQFNEGEIVWQEQWEAGELYPTKRAYREDTDLRFATLMRERHMYPLSFTTWRDGT